jgi:fatty acid synthase
MEPAVEQVVAWAERCGLSGAEAFARAVLTDHIDWVSQVTEARDGGEQGADWFLDLGPGVVASRISADLIEGSGAGIVAAGSLDDVDTLAAPAEDPSAPSTGPPTPRGCSTCPPDRSWRPRSPV